MCKNVPGQHLALNILYAGFVNNFIQLLHGVPAQDVNPGINTGILSLHEGLHSKEALQVGNHHLGHAWNLRQSREPVGGPRSVMLFPSAPGESADAFRGLHCHGLHALPITELRKHVGFEAGDEGFEVGYHPLDCSPSTYEAHANKIVSEPFQKDPNIKLQAIQCCWFDQPVSRFQQTRLQTKATKLQVIFPINAVDSENWPACLPIIASGELTKNSGNILQQMDAY
jgi:hypothetical protein